MHISVKVLAFILIAAVINSCQTNKGGNDNKSLNESKSNITSFKITEGKSLNNDEFTLFSNEDIEFFYPKTWIQKDVADYEFFAYTTKEKDIQNFIVINSFELSSEISEESYFEAMHEYFSSNDDESLSNYKISKLTFESKTSYYAEYETLYHDEDYILFQMLWKDEKHLYDFTLKCDLASKEYYYKEFQIILYNIKSRKGSYFFEVEDELTNLDNVVF